MKRVFAWLLAWVLVPASALAVPATPYDPALMTRYPLLSEQQQTLFDMLYDAVSRREETVWLPGGVGYDEAVAVAEAMLDDCPELCGLDKNYAVGYYRDEPDVALYVAFSYEMVQAEQDVLLREARALATSLAGDKWAKAVQLEEKLCARIVYDAGAPHPYSAYGALMDGMAVCEGYAKAMALVARLAGIPCGIVSGTVWNPAGIENHAWNLIQMDGAWAHADLTWDDTEEHGATYWYFGLTDEQIGVDHAWERSAYPPASMAMNWHQKQNRLLPFHLEAPNEPAKNFVRAMEKLVHTGEPVNLRFESEMAYHDFLTNSARWLDDYNRSVQVDDAFYGAYEIIFSDAQQCVLLYRTE